MQDANSNTGSPTSFVSSWVLVCPSNFFVIFMKSSIVCLCFNADGWMIMDDIVSPLKIIGGIVASRSLFMWQVEISQAWDYFGD